MKNEYFVIDDALSHSSREGFVEKNVTVLENAESLDIPEGKAKELESRGVIYKCPDPECCDISPEFSWSDVENGDA